MKLKNIIGWIRDKFITIINPGWRNWETQWTVNPSSVRTCRFEPCPRSHLLLNLQNKLLIILEVRVMYICEKCFNEHDGSYGSGRFCSSVCARQFSSTIKKDEKNRKISNSLKGRTVLSKEKMSDFIKKGQVASAKIYREKFSSGWEGDWEALSEHLKRVKLLEEQHHKCFICGMISWMDKPIKLQMDHIDGNRFNNRRNNLRMICPNCHSQTDTYCSNNSAKGITDEQIKDALLEHGLKIKPAIESLRLAYGGSNWYRCKRVLSTL